MSEVTTPSQSIQVSVREARMTIERILMTCGIPKGYVPAVRDGILLSQSLGLAGFEGVLEAHSALTKARPEGLEVTEAADGRLRLDAQGMHAWLVLPAAMDLAVDEARRMGRGAVEITHCLAPGELDMAPAWARRYGVVATVRHGREGGTVIDTRNGTRPRELRQSDPWLYQALCCGYAYPHARWRKLYELSNLALAPDSVASRRHAGPVVVDDQGRIVGRTPVDDETDLTTLTTVN